MPVVSITTPTFQRHKFLERQHRIVMAQSEQDFEWLILDDGPEPSDYFRKLNDPRIRYHHHAGGRMSIGAKRNWLADQAGAPVMAHFDDDDYYAPDYLKTMLEQLARRGADIAKFSAWHVYSLRARQSARVFASPIFPIPRGFACRSCGRTGFRSPGRNGCCRNSCCRSCSRRRRWNC
jgi:glycosyltransferase involved in cell wall biosynthesis